MISEKIKVLFELGKYKETLELSLSNLHTSEVELHILYPHIILSYTNLKNYDDAMKFADMALGDYPDLSEFLYYKALIFTYQEKPSQAETYIKKALAIEPENPSYYALYAKALLYQSKNEKAKQMIDKALELDSNDLDIHLDHALILYNLESHSKAEKIVDDVLSKDPQNELALNIKQSLFSSTLKEKESILSHLLSKNPFNKNYQKDLKFINFYYRYVPLMMLFTLGLSYLVHSSRDDFGFLEGLVGFLFVIVGGVGSRDWRFNIPFIAILLAINMYFTHSQISAYIGLLFLAPIYSFFMFGVSHILVASYQRLRDKSKELKKDGENQLSYFLFKHPFYKESQFNQEAFKKYYIFIPILMLFTLAFIYLYNQMGDEYSFLKAPLVISFLIVSILSAKNFFITVLYTFLTIIIINNFECKDDVIWCLLIAFFISPLFLAIYNYITKRRDDG